MSGQGTRYSDEIKDIAYQLWLVEGGRDCTRVKALLASGDWCDPVDVALSTITYWRDHLDWEERSKADMQVFAPALLSRTFAELVLGGPGAARTLRLAASRQEEVDKTAMVAAEKLLHMIGFSPVGRNDASAKLTGGGHVEKRMAALAQLTDEELLERERTLGAGR